MRGQLANLITVSRVGLVFLFFRIDWQSQTPTESAIGIAVYIGLVFLLDGVDGFVARTFGRVTLAGSFLDLAADRTVELVLWGYLVITNQIHVVIPATLLLRMVVVDVCRFSAYVDGSVEANGIIVTRYRRLVLSYASRGGYGFAKAILFCYFLISNESGVFLPSSLHTLTEDVLVGMVLLFSLIRGMPIINEYWMTVVKHLRAVFWTHRSSIVNRRQGEGNGMRVSIYLTFASAVGLDIIGLALLATISIAM